MECYVITGSDILLETLASIDFFLLPPFRGFVGSFVGMLPEVGLSFVATRSFPIDADAFAVRLAQRCSTWETTSTRDCGCVSRVRGSNKVDRRVDR